MQGTRLGPYEIETKLGEGGMGEVYLASDTRLGRKVAIKILPEEFSGDPDRLARFELEARAAAALNHPHIATVHDIGVEDGMHFIVQEYLEGATLRERLESGRLPLVTGLTLAAEIAEALAVAHDAGIVHRDLKPENLFVTEQGHAKVLDFGLAKLTETAAAKDGSATQSPTMLATSAGQIMGTAGYMAPEQITGEEIGTRADIFAFGCILYETVTGRRAFSGKNLPEVLHRLANEDPEPISEIVPSLPTELGRIVRKCLAKEEARRYQGAADLALDLRTLVADIESGRAGQGPSKSEGPKDRRGPVVLAGAGVAGLLLGAALYAALAPPAAMVTGFSESLHLPLGEVAGLDSDTSTQMALSPDGHFLAFATGEGPALLWDLRQGRGERVVAETEGARVPFFSPDSQWLGYLGTDQRLYRVPVDGGRPQPFTDPIGIDVGAATWLESGEILFLTEFTEPVMHIPAPGQPARVLFELDKEANEMGHGPVSYLPDGDQLLYSYWDNRWRIAVHTLSAGTRTELTEGYGARYVPTGHLVWILAQQLMGAIFDPVTLELGEPVQLLSTLGSTPAWGRTAFDFNAQGTLAYLEGAADRNTAVLRLDADGTRTVVRAGDRELDELTLSPDGNRLGLGVRTVDDDHQIWSYDIQREDLVPFGQSQGWDQYPFFTPDGALIGYSSERFGGGDVFVRAADGNGPETHLIKGDPYPNSPHMSPNGDIVARVLGDIWIYPGADPENPTEFVKSEFSESNPQFSADGHFVAYVSNRSGQNEVYVAPYPEGPDTHEWKVTIDGGDRPRWTGDGGYLFYVTGDSIMRARVTQTQPFQTGPAEAFADFKGQALGWDVSADGSYVIAIEELNPPRPRLVLNWFVELERRLPTR